MQPPSLGHGRQALRAAAREDVDQVRAVATRLDTLPKPDLGNKAVARKLNTEGLESLKRGVEQFGAGNLAHRVDDGGRDEVAALATSFNQAADRIETLLRSHQTLLANASHELRSPLARLKMAVSMLDDAPPTMRASLLREIHTNIGELDALVEEVLLSSRLEAGAQGALDDLVDLVGLGAEEASRVGAELQGTYDFGD